MSRDESRPCDCSIHGGYGEPACGGKAQTDPKAATLQIEVTESELAACVEGLRRYAACTIYSSPTIMRPPNDNYSAELRRLADSLERMGSRPEGAKP